MGKETALRGLWAELCQSCHAAKQCGCQRRGGGSMLRVILHAFYSPIMASSGIPARSTVRVHFLFEKHQILRGLKPTHKVKILLYVFFFSINNLHAME